jgi:hypothetical protein
MRRDLRRLSCALAVTTWCFPAVASASDRIIPARLAWVRDESAQSCPDALQMEARLRSRLDVDPFTGTPQRLIEAIVRRTEGIFVAHIAVRGIDGALLGTRDLTSASADCGGLANAAVVAMAMSLTIGDEASETDLDSASSAPPDASDSSPRSASDAPSAAPSSAAPTASATSLAPLHLVVDTERPPLAQPPAGPPAIATSVHASANAMFHGGILPLLGAGFGLQVDARIHRYARVGVGLAWLPDQGTYTLAGRFDFGLTAATAGVCIDVLGSSPHTFAFCAAAWLGGIHTVVYDLQPIAPGLVPWFGISNTIRVSFRLVGPLEIQFEGGGILNVTRNHFALSDGAAVFVQSPIGFIGRVGLGVRFR